MERATNLRTAVISGKTFEGIVHTAFEEDIVEPEQPEMPKIIFILSIIAAATWFIAIVTYIVVKDSDLEGRDDRGEISDDAEEKERSVNRKTQ